MCGIVGYIGNQNSQGILVEGLKKLEYRGYDSAGIAVFTQEGLQVVKAQGRLANLQSKLEDSPLAGSAGIGHTRWATHGKPSDENSHPHTDNSMKFSVVHNGIVENYLDLKEELIAGGCHFVSETDTEVISHLIAREYDGDIVKAVQKAITFMRGAFALGVLTEYEPDKLVAVRQASPLIIGLGEGENFIGSDIPALLEYTRNVYILNDGEMAVLTRDAVELMTIEGNFISREMITVDWDAVTAEKGGYEHFMLKEIHEQPKAYRDTMRGRINAEGNKVVLPELNMTEEQIKNIRNIQVVACGTAYNAGVVGRTMIESLVRIPVENDIASEYRYRSPIVTPETLVIVVSQSGETADTLAALREAQANGAHVLAITNVVGSSIAREANDVLVTLAGPEIAVASTKAYTSQLIAFGLFALYLAEVRGTQTEAQVTKILAAMQSLPEQVEEILAQKEAIKGYAEQISEHKNLFFIGRGVDYAVAQEGSLKLKEISYIHSEAYAAGELKHGTLALIEEGVPVIALATQEAVLEKTVSNIKEVKARGADVLAITHQEHLTDLLRSVDQVFVIPKTLPMLTAALSVVPLQLLSYYASLALGHDVDKPRNLAKSVTVE
ncbi:glutamine--fructose-6-phosphate transaminase (isomerizing) [Paenibacillus sp. FSL R7-0048]|jgi:glucosamine--fructose-6-phosphate aminotransferase (isomerizing)|uniref:Glutamine--fructose-6-phosphate aminotransferase [isomerizing] n=1 Tax=Paenibacillus odorifer TaxID=189426 RepID=A0AB36J7N8_9BACL|nr:MULTISPECIES: glutamine--fructose-6-phosphate transaminase (isomerizing) [Paenibacillus]MDH6430456.1 glucosamine--fructose-6-phosphate aminotransferase (isomerizing) [Paenibacillus sp. PastH-4]MDH6447051.1 glucosamine--fructose-6-phosphate aminotransferase (isomerizing) [Paenibacillus sp. PastF-4]MDH6530848.1 glucosamine--fructose-6-phosphate aminotransferase (isomerizing) [Paenibacillus sp. PastH-3]OMC63152.1 glutamine--fructose-6-phosphate aminotransferase [Paenibacillus odorifer]OMC74085